MPKRLLLLLALLFLYFISMGQIRFVNPSFEGSSSGPDTVPPPWVICTGTPDILPVSGPPWYLSAYNGDHYIDIGSSIESFGQELSCNLIANKTTSFTCYSYSVSYFRYFEKGKLQVWGELSPCVRGKLLWESSNIDTVWNEQFISFIPDKNYTFIEFASDDDHTNPNGAKVCVDDLSEIKIDSFNFLSTSFRDTVIKKYSCVTLAANSDDTTVTYQWHSIPAGFNDTGATVTDCPLINTQYVCTATYGCGYQRYDTVNVEVTPSGVANVQGGEYLSIYPNPAQNELTIDISNSLTPRQITVVNALGQTVISVTPPLKPKTELDISTLAAGIYFIKTQLSNGAVQVNKFVKQ